MKRFNVIHEISSVDVNVKEFPIQAEVEIKMRQKYANQAIRSEIIIQGHPTAIFGKYLFGGRFEI